MVLSAVVAAIEAGAFHDGHEHHDEEPRILLDRTGLEYCELNPAEGDPAAEPPTTLGPGNLPADLSQTFLLHTNPGATKRIYLDFDGHVTSGTSWNSSFTGGANIVTPAFDIDGNTASFSNAELERIQFIWQRVAEDYASFDVDITTQDPGAAALSKSGTSDQEWGIRVVIGGSSSDWYGNAGGVAYVGSFNWSTDTPTFVFEAQLGNGAEKYTAEAISHEVGHTLGLSHDGRSNPSEGYYQGHGSGETGWAPIMGVGYYKELTQWSKGEYAYANNTQDDLSVITTQNGFGYRGDDYGNSISTASPASVSGNTLTAWGVIERSNDVDVFSFSTNTGTVSLSATPFERSPNLDISLELFTTSNTLLASSNPSTQLSASLTNLALSAGVYYVRVSGVGMGDPLSTGYSNYGSLGQYLLTGTLVGVDFDTVSLSAASPVKNEGNSGTTLYSFAVTRSGNTSGSTSVDYQFLAGSTNASDFGGILPSGGRIDFGPGETSKLITVSVSGDLTIESDESFSLQVTGATGSTQLGNTLVQATILNDDIPEFVVAPMTILNTSENGLSASFTVVLAARPAANVIVPVSSSDTTEGIVNVSSLTFTPTNWNVPQTVVVTGQDDTIRDGSVAYSIRLGPSSSSDPAFHNLVLPTLTAYNQDNDKRTIKLPKGNGQSSGAMVAIEAKSSVMRTVQTSFISVLVPVTLTDMMTDAALEELDVKALRNTSRKGLRLSARG